MIRRTLRFNVPPLVLLLCLTVPFLWRPLHVDDQFWVRISELVRQHPFNPFVEIRYPFAGQLHVGRLNESTHPLLLQYYTAAVLALSGGTREWVLHLAYLIFPITAVVAFAWLCRRWLRAPLLAVGLLVVSPGFVVMSHAIMLDVPLLAFWLLAVVATLHGIERQSARWLGGGAAAALAASLTAYQGISVMPLLLAFALAHRQRSRRAVAILLLAPALFLAMALVTWLLAGSPPLAFAHVKYVHGAALLSARNLLDRGASFLGTLGGAVVLPLLVLHLLLRTRRTALLLGASYLLVWAAGSMVKNGYEWPANLLWVLFLGTGLALLVELSVFATQRLRNAWHETFATRRDAQGSYLEAAHWLLLLLWFLGVAFYNIAVMPWGAVRYALPLFPPFILLLASWGERNLGLRSWKRAALVGGAAQLLITLGLAAVDARTASIYRSFAQQTAERLERLQDGAATAMQEGRGATVWFNGDWGFRYYLEKVGARYLLNDPNLPPAMRQALGTPRDGDYLIVPTLPVPHALPPPLQRRLAPVERRDYAAAIPLRLIDSHGKAGFYSHGWGHLPYSVSRRPLEVIHIFRILDLGPFDLAHASVRAPQADHVGLQSFNINGDRRTVLFMHPPASATYTLAIPPEATLRFAIAADPNLWGTQVGDGMNFEIIVAYQGLKKLIFTQYINAKERPYERRWFDHEVSLKSFSGARIELTLQTNPGPADDSRYDGAGWASLRLESNFEK